MSDLVRHHPGLTITCIAMLAALSVLTAIAWLMRASGAALRPVVFAGAFFAIIGLPQLFLHGAAALWPRPELVLDEASIAGTGRFARPEAVFGGDVDPARLRDARPVFGVALDRADIAQLLIRDGGETAVAARFADEAGARSGAAVLWAMFSPRNTTGDGVTSWGTRAAVGDVIALRRIGRAVFMWTGPDRDRVGERIRGTRTTILSGDPRPAWLAAFDDWRVAVAAVGLLVVIATAWFFKGAAWAARIEPATAGRTPVGVAELDHRLATLASTAPSPLSLVKLGEGRWEAIVRYERAWEAGAYRYLLEADAASRRVKVLEYLSSRELQAGAYAWKLQMGITFFRKELDIDLQQTRGMLVRTVTEAGWSWQPLLFDAPRGLAWLAG